MKAAGKDIVIIGYAGSRGAAFLASSHMEKLTESFRDDYLKKQLEDLKEDCGGEASMPLGVLRAVFDLAVSNKCGVRIELKKIPIRQFTIEVCELCGENPYRIETDATLLLCGNGDMTEGIKLAEEYREKNIPAACIGCLTAGLDKVVIDKTNIEYINRN